MNILFTPTAFEDLESIRDYLEPRSPNAAAKMLDNIDTSISFLTDFPMFGRDGRVTGTRELAVPATPYIVVYEIYSETDLYILRILHGREKFPPDPE